MSVASSPVALLQALTTWAMAPSSLLNSVGALPFA